MKNLLVVISVLFLSVLFINSCKLATSPSDSATNTSGTVTVTGQVVDSTTGDPIQSAIVRLSYSSQ